MAAGRLKSCASDPTSGDECADAGFCAPAEPARAKIAARLAMCRDFNRAGNGTPAKGFGAAKMAFEVHTCNDQTMIAATGCREKWTFDPCVWDELKAEVSIGALNTWPGACLG